MINPSHRTQERSPFLKAMIETTIAATAKRSENAIIPRESKKNIRPVIILDRVFRRAVKKLKNGFVKTVDNPSHIAHHAVCVFGFSLNLLIISFSIFIFYHFYARVVYHNLNILLNFISY